MQITIEKMVYGGSALARTDRGVIFVPKAAPGDVVDVEVFQQRKDYARGRILEIISASDVRKTPSCPNFDSVGCCHWDHIQYEKQIEFKRSIIRESLSRLAKFSYEDEIPTVSGPPDAYRLRANFHLHDGALGFVRENSDTIVPIKECAALAPPLNAFIPMATALKLPASSIDVITNGSEISATVYFNSTPANQPWERWRDGLFEIPQLVDLSFAVGDRRLDYRKHKLFMEISGLSFQLTADTFFQANRYLLEDFLNTVLLEAGPAPTDVLDLFSGSGFFSLTIGRIARQVIGIENNHNAVKQARQNATANKIQNVRFTTGDVETILANSDVQPGLVVLNPPRTGAGTRVAAQVAALKAPRIVYVSCNPTTFAPETTILRKNGYRLKRISLIDQFPNTYHIELVAQFELD